MDAFPDAKSALMLVAARLRHVADTRWSHRRYLDMSRLYEQERAEAGAATLHAQSQGTCR